MYQNKQYQYQYQYHNKMPNNQDNRFVGGGFLAPFLLGGITGGLLAPAFYPRPIYPVPIYGPIYPRPYVNNQYTGIYY